MEASLIYANHLPHKVEIHWLEVLLKLIASQYGF